jgi:DNA mismatch repair protein MutS2
VSGKRMKVAASSLIPVAGSGSAAPAKGKTPAVAPERGRSTPPEDSPVSTSEIVLVGQRVDAALPLVEKAINDALLSGKGALRVVHGHGTGRLAAAVKEFLGEHPGVASHRPGNAREGGTAVTIAVLDV